MYYWIGKTIKFLAVSFGALLLLLSVSCTTASQEKPSVSAEIEQVVTIFESCMKSSNDNPQFQRICGAVVAWVPSELPALKSCLAERNMKEIAIDSDAPDEKYHSATVTILCSDKREIDIAMQRQGGKLTVVHVAQVIEDTQ